MPKYIGRCIRKPIFCICENKGKDQPRDNSEADQRHCFHNKENIISLSLFYIRNLKPLASFCGCTAPFMFDLVGNSIVTGFFPGAAHMSP